MAKTPYTGAQLKLAQNFLKRIHAASNNGYLIIAVIAWLRSMKGGVTYKNMAATAYRILRYRTTRYAAIYAAAHGARKGMDPITHVDANAQQALDFLEAIAESDWRADHYGAQSMQPVYSAYRPVTDTYVVIGQTLSTYDQSKNSLVAPWIKMLGFPIVIPADPVKQPAGPTVTQTVKQGQPRSQFHPIIHVGYLSPMAAYDFLKAREEPQDALVGDPRATGV
jgi:hypothetical protein